MENQYTQLEITKIRQHIESHCYADNYLEPTFYLSTSFISVFVILYLIHVSTEPWKLVVLVVLLSLCMMRLFMIFHDLVHKSFFPSDERKTNTSGLNFFVAFFVDFFCLFQRDSWEHTHSTHHKAHGNLNEYDGTRTVLTSSKYEELPGWQKTAYDFARNPFVFFTLMPIYIYWVSRFIHFEYMYIIKYAILLFLLYKVGSWKLVGLFVLAQYIAGIIGLITFHLQHQVNVGFWKPFDSADQLTKDNAELIGASVLTIPSWFEYFTNGIEYHNVHHLDPGIPSYKTKKCYTDLVNKGMIPDNKIGYEQMGKSLFHVIYDERTHRYQSSPFFRSIGLEF